MSDPAYMANVEWKVVDPPAPGGADESLPYVTHEGVLQILDLKLRCGRLSTGEAIIFEEDMEKFMAKLFGGTS